MATGPTNSLNITEIGFVTFDGTSIFHGRTLTAGTGISISNGSGVSGNPTISLAGGGVALEHLTGNTGGALNPDGSNNINIVTANSTVTLVGSGSTLTQDFGVTNLAIGSSLPVLTSGNYNSFFGRLVGATITSANYNCGYGASSLGAITTATSSTAYGVSSLSAMTTGGINTAYGTNSLKNLVTGMFNIGIGVGAGENYNGAEASNIMIQNSGVLGESHVTRIGQDGSGDYQQNACYIAGIIGVTTSNTQLVTINSSTGQLGVRSLAGLTFTDQGTSITLTTNTGYFVTAATTQTLPASPSQGDIVIIECDHAGPIVVTANTGQTIRIGNQVSSSAGTLTNTAIGDTLTLRYRASGTSWKVISSMGNWTVA